MAKNLETPKSLIFLPVDQTVIFKAHITVLKLAHKNKIFIPSSCGGMGTCGTCLVKVLEGADTLPPPDGLEQEMAESRKFKKIERLACQIQACDKLVVKIVNDDMLDYDNE